MVAKVEDKSKETINEGDWRRINEDLESVLCPGSRLSALI
jgi:hypothetical protein